MKEKLNVLQVALFAVNCDNSDEGVLAASNAINDFVDQEKQALKEKIKLICQEARMDDRISALTAKLIIDQF